MVGKHGTTSVSFARLLPPTLMLGFASPRSSPRAARTVSGARAVSSRFRQPQVPCKQGGLRVDDWFFRLLP